MRNFIIIVESRTLLESQGGFVLDPALDPKNYQITDSLRDVSTWRAMTYAANSANETDPQIGEMGEVGYTMISKTTNHIIPISCSDEHHMGFDMLHDCFRKINAADYIPLFYNGNYIYGKSEIPAMLTVVNKWLDYGGPNTTLQGISSLTVKAMSLKDFAEANGEMEIAPGTLAPYGAAIVKSYQDLAGALSRARNNPAMASAKGAVFTAAAQVLKVLSSLGYLATFALQMNDIRDSVVRLKELKIAGDVVAVEQMFFDHSSLKNQIHMKLRNVQKSFETKEYCWGADKAKAIFGDIGLAIDLLGRF